MFFFFGMLKVLSLLGAEEIFRVVALELPVQSSTVDT